MSSKGVRTAQVPYFVAESLRLETMQVSTGQNYPSNYSRRIVIRPVYGIYTIYTPALNIQCVKQPF